MCRQLALAELQSRRVRPLERRVLLRQVGVTQLRGSDQEQSEESFPASDPPSY
jgi:hypothetical protein